MPLTISVVLWVMLVICAGVVYLAPNSKTVFVAIVLTITRMKLSCGMSFTLTIIGFAQVR